MIGKNSVSGKRLMEIVEQIEPLRATKKSLGEQETAILAAAKQEGFLPSGIKLVVKARATKPHDFQDGEQLRDLYLHAAGLATDTSPLFRHFEALRGDELAREALIEALKQVVPRNGDFTYQGGNEERVRIWRDAEGNAHSEVMAKEAPAAKANGGVPRAPSAPVPECSEAEAYVLGETAYRANTPITANPFPFGDKRRPHWDKGWRAGSGGGDGMGPGDD